MLSSSCQNLQVLDGRCAVWEQSATAPALVISCQDLQVLDARFPVCETICHGCSTAELLPRPTGPGWQMCCVGTICHSYSVAELLSGPVVPGWQICAVGNNLPQLQCCGTPANTCRSWMTNIWCARAAGLVISYQDLQVLFAQSVSHWWALKTNCSCLL